MKSNIKQTKNGRYWKIIQREIILSKACVNEHLMQAAIDLI